MRPLARRMIGASFVLALAVLAVGDTGNAQAPAPLVLYQPPVDALVIDGFRPPAHIGAPGNRGLEYGITTSALVVPAASGRVSFAGQVAGNGVIVVQHDDGLRTTYTGLIDIWVVVDAGVLSSQAIGTAGPGFHFGARIGNEYLDPQILIDASAATPSAPRLVVDPDHPVLGG